MLLGAFKPVKALRHHACLHIGFTNDRGYGLR
jgi:hypothetical protein